MNNNSECVTKRMIQPGNSTKGNIIMVHFIINVLSEIQLTVIGTLRKNKICIPKELSMSKNREIHSSFQIDVQFIT